MEYKDTDLHNGSKSKTYPFSLSISTSDGQGGALSGRESHVTRT